MSVPDARRLGEAGVPCDHEDEWRDEEQTGVTEHVAEASGDDRHAAALCCSIVRYVSTARLPPCTVKLWLQGLW